MNKTGSKRKNNTVPKEYFYPLDGSVFYYVEARTLKEAKEAFEAANIKVNTKLISKQ